MQIAIPTSGSVSLFNDILAVSKPRNEVFVNFDLHLEEAEWFKIGHTEKYFYRALHKFQPGAQEILERNIIAADSWCSNSIYTACAFSAGRNRAPQKGSTAIVAVFETQVERAVRPFNTVHHYITLLDAKVNAMLKVTLI